MKISQLKEIVKKVVSEETEYQQLFMHMLDKTGKDIGSMSDDETTKFFNAVDRAYKAKSEGKLKGYNENTSFGFKVNEAYDGPVILKTGNKNTFKVGEKVTFADAGKPKKEYTVVKSSGNGDFVLRLVESVNEATIRKGTKIRTYVNGKSDIVDYVLEKPNHYNAIKGGKTNLFKVINSTNSKIKVGSTQEFSTSDLKGMIKNHIASVLESKSVNEATDDKKKFMFAFYTDSKRNTERETNYMATTLESAIKAAEHMCKITGYTYVEIYYKGLLLGGMEEKNKFKFVPGKGYAKYKSTNESVNEGIWPKSKLASTFQMQLSLELKKNFKGVFYGVGNDLYHNDKKVLTVDGDNDSINSIIKKLKSKIKESVNAGKYDSELDKVEAAVKNESSFMDADRKAAAISNVIQLDKKVIKKFIEDNNLDANKIHIFVKKNYPKNAESFVQLMKRPNNSSLKNFTNESVNEGKYDSELDKVEAAVKNATSFMNVGAELKKAGIKYDFSTSMIPMYRIKVSGNTIAIVNKKYAAGAEREVNGIAIGIMENTVKKSVTEANNPGDKFTHKHNPKIEIELIEPTNKGWKVYQTEKGKKKIAYFDKQDISGNNSLFKSVNEAFTHQKVKNRIYFELDKRESVNTSVQKKK
jgi:Arc/MetJ-type ribon-helix-helix transcriptional regulator